jgi:hypothetical protein
MTTLDSQVAYMKRVAEDLHKIIPPELQHKHCLMFGMKVVLSFDHAKDALKYMEGSHLALCYVPPLRQSLSHNETKACETEGQK